MVSLVPVSLRQVVFPTLQKNQSPFSILPAFIKCLGVKVDNAQVQQDYIGQLISILTSNHNSTQKQHLYSFPLAGKARKTGSPSGKGVSWTNDLFIPKPEA